MEEPERGEENEIDLQAIEEECPVAVVMSPGEKAATKAKLKEILRDPRQRTRYLWGPRVDLSGITILGAAHPAVPEVYLKELCRTRASMRTDTGTVDGHVVGASWSTGALRVVFVGSDRFAGACVTASATQQDRWLPARRWSLADAERVTIFRCRRSLWWQRLKSRCAIPKGGKQLPAPEAVMWGPRHAHRSGGTCPYTPGGSGNGDRSGPARHTSRILLRLACSGKARVSFPRGPQAGNKYDGASRAHS